MGFSSYEEAAKSFRNHLLDKPQLNILEREFENTDEELIEYIKDALNDINITFTPTTYFALSDICTEPGEQKNLPWSLVKLGATLQLLTSQGILSSRNTVMYSDSGGVQVNEFDKFGRYINYYNILITKYQTGVTNLKRAWNVQQIWGGVRSPMDTWIW